MNLKLVRVRDDQRTVVVRRKQGLNTSYHRGYGGNGAAAGGTGGVHGAYAPVPHSPVALKARGNNGSAGAHDTAAAHPIGQAHSHGHAPGHAPGHDKGHHKGHHKGRAVPDIAVMLRQQTLLLEKNRSNAVRHNRPGSDLMGEELKRGMERVKLMRTGKEATLHDEAHQTTQSAVEASKWVIMHADQISDNPLMAMCTDYNVQVKQQSGYGSLTRNESRISGSTDDDASSIHRYGALEPPTSPSRPVCEN
jgi:hypothetical protein